MKKRKKVDSVLFIVFVLFICIGGVFPKKTKADTGLRFQPRADVNWLDYKLELKPSAALANLNLILSDSVPAASIGATFFYNKFYLDLSYLHTAKGYSGISSGTFLEVDPQYGLPLDADTTIVGSCEYYHWNYAITVGYQLLDNFTLYAGYKNNNTKFDAKAQSIFHMIDDGTFGNPGLLVISSLDGNFDIKYEANGPFVGCTYGFIIGDKGVLSLNLAVAYLNGDITQSGKYIDPRTGFSDDVFDLGTSGDSIGLSYSIGWRSNLTEKLGYYLSIKGYNYNFNADQSDRSDFQELTYQFSLGLSYNF